MLLFLPQDRVCEFAKLTPVQLLEETEKAVGDPPLPIQQHAPIGKSRELKNIQLVSFYRLTFFLNMVLKI